MAEKGTMDKFLDHSIKHWTQSNSFRHVLTLRALNSPRYMQPMAKFVKFRTENTGEEWYIPEKAEALPLPDLGDPWPQSPSLPTFKSEEKHKKHYRTHRRKQTPKVKSFEKAQINQNQYSSASIDRDTNSLPSGHHPFFPDLSGQSDAGAVPLQSHFLETESALSILQIVKRNHFRAIGYQTYRLSNCSMRYDETV